MKVIDARSGQHVHVDSWKRTVFNPPLRIDYGGGEFHELHAVEPGLIRARALSRYSGGPAEATWNPLTVRWTHPRFPLEHVAFINS